MIKIDFAYTDEDGQESKMSKAFDKSTLEVTGEFELLFDEFKTFLRVVGFTGDIVDRIKYVE